MEIRSDSIDFSSPLRGSGPRAATKTVLFPRNVLGAVAAMSGYLAEFSPTDDHHVGRLEVTLATAVDANTVTVTGHLGVRDWSGNWDDNYDGSIDFVVLAQLEAATGPLPRGDLTVTGVEFNQATQFFRAGRYLDAANVQPDNSIFMVDGKATGVRVYVDFDASSGLPPIGALSGTMIVNNGSGSTTLTPINGPIVPKRDAQINQALANDTLNFMIPASLSTGTLTVSVRVFDSSHPDQSSGNFTRSLTYTAIEPLNIFVVGIQTLAPAAPAPSQAAIVAAFSMLQSTYPRGVIQFTGFNTATLTPNIAGSTATSGCGTAWEDLLQLLRDLRGGSGDLYFGGLPPGIATAGVIGCSPVGERIAGSFIDLIATIPHEVGHALGRNHDPCRGCSPPAQDPDDNYPQYGSFSSDSIGVFGFDPATNTVFNPASSLDFMTAFLASGEWVSPYTYRALLGPVQGGPAPGGAKTMLKGDRETLFLGLDIARDRKVTRRVSFHHPAALQGSGAGSTQFSYELLDRHGAVLDCGALYCGCATHACHCWPKKINQALPYPSGAANLNVYEDETKIHGEDIPQPPTVYIRDTKAIEDGIELHWDASADAEAFLVHCRDPKAGQWRGLAPRLVDRSIVIPGRFFAKAATLDVRVLASSGIATGFAELTLRRPSRGNDADRSLSITWVDSGGHVPLPSAVAHAVVVDASGASLAEDTIAWYAANGESLGRGSRVDLRRLPQGQQTVQVVVTRHGGFTARKAWVVRRERDSFTVVASLQEPARKPRQVGHDHPHPRPATGKD